MKRTVTILGGDERMAWLAESLRREGYIIRLAALLPPAPLKNRLPQPETPDRLLPESEMNLWPDNMDASAWYYAQIQEATNSHDFVWAGEFEQWTQKLPERDWDALQR